MNISGISKMTWKITAQNRDFHRPEAAEAAC